MNIGRKLNYNDNMKEVLKKVNHKIWMLANTRKYLTQIQYNGKILLFFDYGGEVTKIYWINYINYKIEHLRYV